MLGHFVHLAETLLLKSNIPDSQHFIND